jgi:hypothetical protein
MLISLLLKTTRNKLNEQWCFLERKIFKINKMFRELEVKSWKRFKYYKNN